jgi:hypothetical protein
MYFVALTFLLVFILYILYKEEIDFYVEYSINTAAQAAESGGLGELFSYYKYHTI